MNLELFLARRLYSTRKGGRRISRPAVAIAQWGVAVGTLVMFVSICIIVGFKNQVRDKAIGFGGHIQVKSYTNATEGETPITVDCMLMDGLRNIPGVRHVQRFAMKPGMIIANNEYEGVIIKGIGAEYDNSFFAAATVEGTWPQYDDSIPSGKIVISRLTAEKLDIGTGDKIDICFMQGGIRVRRMTIAAIYETHLSEMDNVIAFTDICTVQRLNEWSNDKASALEITVNDIGDIYNTREYVNEVALSASTRNMELLHAPTFEELYPALFSWLAVLDQTVWLILVLVLCIAGFTMVSGLLILILEKSNLIGILKAVGARDVSIRKIFIYYACIIIGKGLVTGNIIAVALCLLQKELGIVALDPRMYYMDRVPIEFSWILVPMNVCMFIVSAAMLVAPSMMISHIAPVKAIKFE